MSQHPLVSAFVKAFPTESKWTPEGRRLVRYQIKSAVRSVTFHVSDVDSQRKEIDPSSVVLYADEKVRTEILIRSKPFYKEHRFDDGEYSIGVWASYDDHLGEKRVDLDLWMTERAMNGIRKLVSSSTDDGVFTSIKLRRHSEKEDEAFITQLHVWSEKTLKRG